MRAYLLLLLRFCLSLVYWSSAHLKISAGKAAERANKHITRAEIWRSVRTPPYDHDKANAKIEQRYKSLKQDEREILEEGHKEEWRSEIKSNAVEKAKRKQDKI